MANTPPMLTLPIPLPRRRTDAATGASAAEEEGLLTFASFYRAAERSAVGVQYADTQAPPSLLDLLMAATPGRFSILLGLRTAAVSCSAGHFVQGINARYEAIVWDPAAREARLVAFPSPGVLPAGYEERVGNDSWSENHVVNLGWAETITGVDVIAGDWCDRVAVRTAFAGGCIPGRSFRFGGRGGDLVGTLGAAAASPGAEAEAEVCAVIEVRAGVGGHVHNVGGAVRRIGCAADWFWPRWQPRLHAVFPAAARRDIVVLFLLARGRRPCVLAALPGELIEEVADFIVRLHTRDHDVEVVNANVRNIDDWP